MKALLLLVPFALCGSFSYAQSHDTAYVIHYNFLNGKLQVPKHINWHPPVYRPFVVQIDSINRGAFKIKITSRDSVLANSDPTAFTNAFNKLQQVKPSVTDSAASDEKLNKTVDSAKAMATQAKQNTTARAAKKGVKAPEPSQAEVAAEVKQNNSAAAMQDLGTGAKTDSTPRFADTTASGKKEPAVDTALRRITYDNLRRLFFHLRYLKYDLLKAADSVSFSISDIGRSMNAMKNHFMIRQRFVQTYLSTEDSLRKRLLRVKQIYGTVPGLADELHVWEDRSKQFFNDTFFRTIDDAALANVQDVYSSIHVDSLLVALDRINLALNYLQSDEFYRYTSPPITPFGDMIIVNVAIEAIDNKDSTQPDDAKVYELKLFTKNRFRFDFSTGLGALFNLSDRAYHMANIGTDSVNITQNKQAQKITPVVAAFLHGGFDIGSSFKPALTLGMSLDASTIDITTILFGASAMLGRDEKLELTAGWATKKISVLKSDFEPGKTYAKTDVGGTIPTESVFKGGWFVSLSYNLTNKQKQK